MTDQAKIGFVEAGELIEQMLADPLPSFVRPAMADSYRLGQLKGIFAIAMTKHPELVEQVRELIKFREG